MTDTYPIMIPLEICLSLLFELNVEHLYLKKKAISCHNDRLHVK